MDYVVGSVAALISGNVTPNRPRLTKRALTPVKHRSSPNVTPKSEIVDDRTVFMSPTLQKKKAIVRKSPKRIFESADLDITKESDADKSSKTMKAEKVKKHLQADLDTEISVKNMGTNMSPKRKQKKVSQSENTDNIVEEVQSPNKKKKRQNSESVNSANNIEELTNANNKLVGTENNQGSPKKKNKKSKQNADLIKDKKNNNVANENESDEAAKTETTCKESPKKKKKKNKQAASLDKQNEIEEMPKKKKGKKNKKKGNKQEKNFVNPNSITEKDTESEHESDDDLNSENEKDVTEALTTEPLADLSDEEDTSVVKEKGMKAKGKLESEETYTITPEELKRTLFVGNVPFTKKCKKEIKKIFGKYGRIDSVR